MTTATKPLTEIAAEWREARRLYEVYSSLLGKFALGLPPCHDLESPIDRNEPEAIERIHAWFAQMDERVHVHQLRQLLQTSKLGTEENLRSLIRHHLDKEKKSEADRDKIDFLLVQYLSACAPAGFYEKNVTFDEIAQVLEPVLGEVGSHPPKWQEPLEKATDELENLRSLRDLLEQGTLDQMRKLKISAGEMYFGPTALVAITRFNFMVRRSFVRLIAADLHAIRFSLNELERKKVKAVDCTRAGLSKKETLEGLREICQEWKKPFRAAYAAGQNFKELSEIRTAVEDALARAGEAAASVVEEDASFAAPTSNGVGSAATVADHEEARDSGSGQKESDSVKLQFETAKPTQANSEPGLLSHAESAAPSPSPEAEDKEEKPEAKSSAPDLQSILEHIAQELEKLNIHDPAVANVVFGGVKLMLSSWEVGAFVKGGDETADALQRAVAARGILAGELDRRKRSEAVDLKSAVALAKAESAKIQERIAAAKQAKDIDSAVNLAATSKRLLGLLDEAEKAVK